MEHVVQFDATRRTLPGLEVEVVGAGNGDDPARGAFIRCCMAVVSSCREMLG